MASVLDLVKHYQHSIEKYPNDEQKILKCIDKLYNLDVTVQHLQDTGVGRTVNALRKEPEKVGQAARALVYKWKCMVAAEASDQEGDHDTKTYNGHGTDSEDYTKQHSIKQEQNVKQEKYVKPNISSMNIKTEDYKQINGNHSSSKRKHQTNEDEKSSMKRSKYSSSSDNDDYKRTPVIKIKKELSDSESDDTDDSQSESDSEESESSREEINVKQEVKVEPSDKHRSSSSKHSSNSNHVEQKRDSSVSKKSNDSSEKHSSTHSHISRSKEKYSPEKSSSKEKSQSTHKHKSSKEKDDSFEIKQKTEHKSSEIEKESKSSSKHSSSDRHKSSSRKSESSSEKHESNNAKHVSKSEKHKSHSHNSEKEKHKSSSEKEISTHKHKTKDSSVSNSSKDKHSSSSKDKSQDRSSSSKEKSSSHSEKKHSSSNDSKSNRSDNKSQSEKGEDKSKEKKSKHKSSSSSSKKSSKSSSKSKEDEPKKKAKSNSEDSDDGIDCGSGASFAEALGMMLSPTKPKKKLLLKDSHSPNNSFNNDLSPAALLAPSAKLAPLPALEISALPEISPNYKPRPPPKLLAHLNDEDAMCAVISSKNQRTKVYSGNKVLGKIPTLYEMCVQILQEHIDALEYTGGVPYEILKPVVDKATPQQLFLLEHYNPYLMEDTDHLWQKFCEKHFRNKHRQEMETSREMYIRCQEEQEHRLKSLTANIRMTQEAKKAPIKQTKMAYVDSVVKPPRNVARKQAVHGTAHLASASPAARVASLAGGSNVLRAGRVAPPPAPGAAQKPKRAPLMAKALQLMRGRKR